MNTLRTYVSWILFVCALAFLSCERLEIPDNEHTNGVESNGNKDDGNGSSGSSGEDADGEYSVSDIINGRFTKTKDVYVVGYIVGYVKTSSMDFCRFARGDVETNIIIADTPVDTFANRCIPVQLTTANLACKATRTALNLAKNDVLGQKVVLQGDIDSYMGVDYGILKARNHTFLENDYEEGGSEGNAEDLPEEEDSDTPDCEDDNPQDPPTPDGQEWADLVRYIYSHGTEDAPFTVADFKTALPEYLGNFGAPEIGHPGMKDVYVCGYIVGYVPKGYSKIEKAVFCDEGAPQTNIILADLPDEQDYNNCIAVELSLSSDRHSEAREALNLADHPENYKKRFIIFGNITDQNGYMGTLGLKSARECIPCEEE